MTHVNAIGGTIEVQGMVKTHKGLFEVSPGQRGSRRKCREGKNTQGAPRYKNRSQ